MTFGVVFALLASATFALNAASMRRGMATAAASKGLYVTIFVGFGLFVIASVVSGQVFDADTVAGRDYGFLVAGGFFHILAGRYCNYRAMGALGSNRAQPIVGLSTLGSVIIAILFLDEKLGALKVAGIVLVMVGPALARPKRRAAPAKAPVGGSGDVATAVVASKVVAFTPKVVEGYFFGLSAAVLWGAGPDAGWFGRQRTRHFRRDGCIWDGGGSAIVGVADPGQASGVLTLDKSTRGWFLFGAFNSFLANVFRFTALALAPVSIVIPLMRSSVVFIVGFNWLLNRELESFDRRVIGGIGVSMFGAVLLVI
ncbi:MAG: DMT family transporter [Chloroflexi bacterium]|nr:DMT family transporter [Chloroflexota bacterium]